MMLANEIDEIAAIGLCVWHSEGGRRMAMAHRHQDLEFNYLIEGTMRYLIGGALVTIPQNQLCVLWGSMPHQSITPDPTRRMMLATLPLSQALLWNLPGEFLRRLLGRGIVIDPQTNAGDLPMLQQWQRDLEKNEAARRQLVEEEIAGRLRRLALNAIETEPDSIAAGKQSTPAPTSGDALRLTEKMAALISEKFRQPLTAGEIARHVHLHPNYAMTLFRKQTGITLNGYLTRQRVAHAQRLLAMTSLPILDIAQECGFQSVSRFYEAFKAESSCTPSQFRKRLAPP